MKARMKQLWEFISYSPEHIDEQEVIRFHSKNLDVDDRNVLLQKGIF